MIAYRPCLARFVPERGFSSRPAVAPALPCGDRDPGPPSVFSATPSRTRMCKSGYGVLPGYRPESGGPGDRPHDSRRPRDATAPVATREPGCCRARRSAGRHVAAPRRGLRRRLVLELGPASSAAGAPPKGGMLQAGFVGGGTAETVDPFIGVTPIDEGRIQNLYDPLVIVNPDLSTAPGLALEWNPTATPRSTRSSCAPTSPSTTASRSAPTTSSTRSSRCPSRRELAFPFVSDGSTSRISRRSKPACGSR